jgi:hypothetical protein
MITKVWHTVLMVLLLTGSIKAQEADAVLSPSEILIGEQAVINLSVRYEKGKLPKVQFPVFGDTIITHVEIVRSTDIDTLTTSEDVRETRMEKKFFITSFDSGYYAIPPFEILIDGEIQVTEPFLLTVKTVEIDTTAGIKASRDIYEVEVTWLDYLTAYWYYPAGALALVGLIAAMVLLIRRAKRRAAEKPEVVPAEPRRPADVIARERLEEIRQNKIYTRGKVKEYHTEITDVLRDYLEAVYEIPAHELTTHQILGRLRYVGLNDTEARQLREILSRADMVKFAKERPDETENESAVTRSIDFVNSTAARMLTDKEIHE